MNANVKSSVVFAILTVLFLALTAAFIFQLWGRPEAVTKIPPTDPEFTNTATVRMSAAELVRTDGDTSGFNCYACHDEKKRIDLRLDANGKVVLPKEHEDIVMRHGRNNRNDLCFNCHDQNKLDALRTRDGQQLKIVEGTLLCASCHGPTYRDWEAGIHGRTSGHWDRKLGAITKQDCTSCHNPHAPEFQSIKPGPAPHSRYWTATTDTNKRTTH